jgi:murein DD-endopeptidase MepM/ murein hydrolase activator NlpD
MKKRNYTLLLIPEDGEGARNIKVSSRHISLLKAGVCAFSILTVLMVISFITAGLTFKINNRLVDENELQQLQLKDLVLKINKLSEKMISVAKYQNKLRMITGTEGKGIPQSIISVGDGVKTHDNEYLINTEDPSKYYNGELSEAVELLIEEADIQQKLSFRLEEVIADQQAMLSSTPSIWPCKGWVTSPFGYRVSPFTGLMKMHSGIDVAAAQGTPIVATGAGVVTFAGSKAGYGNTVVVDHGYGITSYYGHNYKNLAEIGDRVARGEKIALLGCSGRCTGPHSHYEIRVNNVPVNPYNYILE